MLWYSYTITGFPGVLENNILVSTIQSIIQFSPNYVILHFQSFKPETFQNKLLNSFNCNVEFISLFMSSQTAHKISREQSLNHNVSIIS